MSLHTSNETHRSGIHSMVTRVTRAWRQEILPGRVTIIALVMIVGALIAAVTAQPETLLWRRSIVVGALSLLLALNLIPPFTDTRSRPESLWRVALYLTVASPLYLVAFGMSRGPASSVIVMLLFLLVGQATWALPLAAALIYAVGMMIGVSAIIAFQVSLEAALQVAASLGFGIVFVMMFIQLSQRYEQQTEQAEAQRARAEELLAQLQASHAELRAARERELKMAAIEERVRLARDIHDGLGHYLTILNVQLQAAALIYAVAMMIGVSAIIAFQVSLEAALQVAASLGFGIVFVMMFIQLSQRYEQQTEHAETQRARAEELLAQLQASHAELRAARERELKMAAIEERVRLARDIHDGLGHYLTILNVQLQAAARLLQRDPQRAAAVIATCREVTVLLVKGRSYAQPDPRAFADAILRRE